MFIGADEKVWSQAVQDRRLFGSPGVDGSHLAQVEAMLRDGMDPNADRHTGESSHSRREGVYPLVQACIGGDENLGMVDLLLRSGADPNQRDNHGQSALHAAANGGHKGLVSRLIEEQADVNAVDGADRTPLYVAVERRITRLRVESTEKTDALDTIDLLLAAKANPNGAADGDKGRWPLYEACRGGDAEAAARLLAAGANPNQVVNESTQDTVLMQAAQYGHTEVARALLKAGADPKLTKANGKSTARDCATGDVEAAFAEHERDELARSIKAIPCAEPTAERRRGLRL